MSQLNNNQISNEPSDAPQLCNSCFEFFGSAHTENLCSGCFKKKCKEQTAQLKPIVNVKDNSDSKTEANSPSISHKASIDEESIPAEVKQVVEIVEEKSKPVEKETNKCTTCTKKVGVLGHVCKCGFKFCKNHRLPEDHDCTFDFKQAGVAKLTKDNPLIMASKVAKI